MSHFQRTNSEDCSWESGYLCVKSKLCVLVLQGEKDKLHDKTQNKPYFTTTSYHCLNILQINIRNKAGISFMDNRKKYT